MNVIGLDFGTTNSILSFYNKTNSVESWKLGGSDGKNYIPSILTFDESDLFIVKIIVIDDIPPTIEGPSSFVSKLSNKLTLNYILNTILKLVK